MIYARDIFVKYQSINGTKYLAKNFDAFELDEIGDVVWNSIDGKVSMEDISILIAEKYNVNKSMVIKDITEFCNELLEKGLIEEITNE